MDQIKHADERYHKTVEAVLEAQTLLDEYQGALITEVVTGQLDVTRAELAA